MTTWSWGTPNRWDRAELELRVGAGEDVLARELDLAAPEYAFHLAEIDPLGGRENSPHEPRSGGENERLRHVSEIDPDRARLGGCALRPAVRYQFVVDALLSKRLDQGARWCVRAHRDLLVAPDCGSDGQSSFARE